MDRGASNASSKIILKEIRSIKNLIKPSKKTVRVIKPALIQNSLTKAVKHSCSNDVKFTLIEWIQKTHNKQVSDEISKEIGLNESKQIRKRLPVDHSKDTKVNGTSTEKIIEEKEVKKLVKAVTKPEKMDEEQVKKIVTPQKLAPSVPKSPIKKEVKEIAKVEVEAKKEVPAPHKETQKEVVKEATKEADNLKKSARVAAKK